MFLQKEMEIYLYMLGFMFISFMFKDIAIKGYNVFRCDRPRKGGGIAIYVKCKFHVIVQSSLSLSSQFQFLALKLELLKGCFLTIVGCYRPPSASSETLSSLTTHLSTLAFNEILLTGDLNWIVYPQVLIVLSLCVILLT